MMGGNTLSNENKKFIIVENHLAGDHRLFYFSTYYGQPCPFSRVLLWFSALTYGCMSSICFLSSQQIFIYQALSLVWGMNNEQNEQNQQDFCLHGASILMEKNKPQTKQWTRKFMLDNVKCHMMINTNLKEIRKRGLEVSAWRWGWNPTLGSQGRHHCEGDG